MPAPAPVFLQSLLASLAYWMARVQALEKTDYSVFESHLPNLLRALEAGFAFPETQNETTSLALEMFEFIELRNYVRGWLPVLERALSCTPPWAVWRGKLLNQLGFLHMLNRAVPQALTCHQEAETWARTNQEGFQLANAKLGLAQDYFAAHQFQLAIAAGQEALALFKQYPAQPQKLASTQNILGMIYHATGDYAQAECAFLEAIRLCVPLNLATWQAQYLNNLGISLSAAQKYEAALASHLEALTLLEFQANPLTKVFTQNALGSLYLTLARYAEAEAIFHAIDLGYLRQSGATYWLATYANNLANVYLKQQQFARAELLFRQALPLWHQVEDDINYANTLGDLAETLGALNRTAEALPLYEEALQLLARFPQHARARQLHTHLEKQKVALGKR